MNGRAAPGRFHEDHPGLAPFARDPRRACRDTDTDVFFPVHRHGTATQAKAICRQCIFCKACREWAVTAPELAGYWGASSPGWRRDERQRRGLADRTEVEAA